MLSLGLLFGATTVSGTLPAGDGDQIVICTSQGMVTVDPGATQQFPAAEHSTPTHCLCCLPSLHGGVDVARSVSSVSPTPTIIQRLAPPPVVGLVSPLRPWTSQPPRAPPAI
ncbi:hypothetical protein CCC_04202 [Paramagnetospirillum magnetotacticum MS-1]|uniref:DUF2946 domain-containing protein n=1 Tax=Paramagnetospirillum magnetotacticum MS-1 TaxID=272627 RepID=A0A0C2V2W8_PARME|nr:DUF2946 family protein [Paramagnetospirillum magnetotacticum]KIL99431.1 hypothetical protein CCC_04202 [Paramagnetospirillum magnetotacticum MS-1]